MRILSLRAAARWIVTGGVLCGAAWAQLLHPSGPRPSFAVASVRASRPDERMSGGDVSPDRWVEKGTTVRGMIMYAYGLGFAGEMEGEPAWAHTEQFTVEGKLDEAQVEAQKKLSRGDADEQKRLMVQSLLAERFGLVVRFETKTLAVYELTVAKGGFKCKSDSSPQAIAVMDKPRFRWSAPPPPPPPPPGWVPPTPDEMRGMTQSMNLRTKGWPFWLVVTLLSHQPELGERPVIDKTGIDGQYNCQLSWSQQDSGGSGPSLFTAVDEQLGLKLTPAKGPVEVLVVEHLEKPSEN